MERGDIDGLWLDEPRRSSGAISPWLGMTDVLYTRHGRAREAFLAAGTLYHIVALCSAFGRWPSWGDEALFTWLGKQEAGSDIVELSFRSAEFDFVQKHVEGKCMLCRVQH
jgi:hypothetical protein